MAKRGTPSVPPRGSLHHAEVGVGDGALWGTLTLLLIIPYACDCK